MSAACLAKIKTYRNHGGLDFNAFDPHKPSLSVTSYPKPLRPISASLLPPQVFKPNGGIVARFGSDQLCCPRGIVADPLGHLFVVDSDHHRICVFDPFGKFLQELALPIKLDYPMSLDYLPQERLLLVTQCSFMHYNHCVMLFKVHYDHEMKENLSVLLPANC